MMKLLGSLSFRLALTYAGLFLASVTMLLGLFYWVSIIHPLGKIKQEIRAEVEQYVALYDERGEQALVNALRQRAYEKTSRLGYHVFLNRDGRALAANVPSWPEHSDAEWLYIEADISRGGDETDHEALLIDVSFDNGQRLLLGRDVADFDDIDEGIRESATWIVPTIALLMVLGGALMSRAISKRIDAIDKAARQVMQGSLAGRVPLRNSNDDFDRLGQTLNSMLERVERSVESVRRVSDSVAHELRTPLAHMHAMLSELKQTPQENTERRVQEAIVETEHLIRIFDAVLRISRIESGRYAPARKVVELDALLSDAVELYSPAQDGANIDLIADIAPGLQTTGDADLLFQAIANLLDNSMKYSPPAGAIRLSARNTGDFIEITIDDNGPGVPEAQRPLIIERFYRGTAPNKVSGYGLGLALVDTVARLHDSTLLFEDNNPGLRVIWRLRPSSGNPR